MATAAEILGQIDREIEGRRHAETLEEERARLTGSFRDFIREAWPYAGIGHRLVPTWHLDTLADHVQAAYEREIPRLAITIQPGAMKSSIVSVLGPAWRWASEPEEQIVSASYANTLSARDTRRSRSVMTSPWYQRLWPHVQLLRDENLKTRYTNTRGGWRIATHVGGGTGERGSVLILDDPHNANDANAVSGLALQNAREWMGNTWASRLNMVGGDPGVKIVIGQRVHEKDVIGGLLEGDETGDEYVHLCLPTRYEPTHPFVYPAVVFTSSGRELQGDIRTAEGELLEPAVMDDRALARVQSDMSEQTKQAQYQQRPTPREGAILKRADWRYYPRAFLEGDRYTSLPTFRMIVCSWDTSFKAKVTSDKVAGQAWGISLRWAEDEQGRKQMDGSDHYLLAARHERLSLQQTKDAMKDMRRWCVERWPQLPVYVLIEKSANGVEIIEQLQREITGVVVFHASVDKKVRAEAAAPALESHNVYVPGEQMPDGTGPDPARTDAWVMEGIEQAARFRGVDGDADDWVDAFTQMVNWVRTKDLQPSTLAGPPPSARVRIGGIGEGRQTGIRINRGR